MYYLCESICKYVIVYEGVYVYVSVYMNECVCGGYVSV